MRFLSMIRVNENSGQVPSEQLMQDMGKLMDEMTREGVLIRTAGLRPTREGVRVRLRKGQLSTVDGPFTETKEVIGGFAILEAASVREARTAVISLGHSRNVSIIGAGTRATNFSSDCHGG